MYKKKKMIGITGPPASGKSFLLRNIGECTNVLTIDCDKIVASIMPKSERVDIIESQGISKLCKILYPLVKAKVYNIINSKLRISNVVVIEGARVEDVFGDILDIVLRCDKTKEVRMQRALLRGNSIDEFEYYEKLYNERS